MTAPVARWKVPEAELPQRVDFPQGKKGWSAFYRARAAVCRHAFDQPRWAGILGWRYDCGQCGKMYIPAEHAGCTECRGHPSKAAT